MDRIKVACQYNRRKYMDVIVRELEASFRIVCVSYLEELITLLVVDTYC